MPLTTSAEWPTLYDGRKARASDVELKFDWLEGNQMPMAGGTLTASVYDLGSSTYPWRTGYFSNIVVGGETMTAGDVGIGAKAWGVATLSGTATVAIYNVSSITRTGVGTYHFQWTIPFSSANYVLLADTYTIGSVSACAVINSMTAGGALVYTFVGTSTASDRNISVIAYGEQ